jgi:uncharacterized membrane protein YphA (DoxX/SURF4 family)
MITCEEIMNLKFKNFKYSKDVVLDALRVYIGVALVGKGIYFIQNLNELFELTNTAVSYGDFILSHYIIFAHIVGGLCITFGLLTRMAILANMPILFGAIAFVHLQEGFFTPAQGLEVSMLVFFLLCVGLYHGSGRWSVDYYINKNSDYGPDEDNVLSFSDYLSTKKMYSDKKSEEEEHEKKSA